MRPKARTKAAHEEDAVSLGNGCVSGALEQRAINPCEAFIACRRRAVPSEARRIGSMKLADGLYAETSPFCFGIFAEAILFCDKSEKNGGIKAVCKIHAKGGLVGANGVRSEE